MKNRAFTLIELMTTIVILGLLVLIIVPNVEKTIRNAKDTFYDKQVKMIELGAQNWGSDNLLLLPQKDGDFISLTIDLLKMEGYVDLDVKNPKDGKCLPNDMTIVVTKVKNNYTYSLNPDSGTEGNCSSISLGAVVILNGPSIQYIDVNSEYKELSARGRNEDGSVNSSVNTIYKKGDNAVTSISTNAEGEYKAIYSILDDAKEVSATRTIIIKDVSGPILNIPDNTILSVDKVNSFNPLAGVTTSDNSGYNPTVDVKGNVSSIPGTYILTYTAMDNSGNKTVKTRTIIIENIFDNMKGVNRPQLSTGMTPIKWVNGVETVTTIDDQDWYDYSNKKWANVKTKDGSYWVWIPRYAYKITSGYHSNVAGQFDIVFLKETSLDNANGISVNNGGYNVSGLNTSNTYFLHPAFNDNSSLGFWVAKFEPTAAEGISSTASSCSASDNVSTKTIKILPNATSWRCISVANAFNISLNMKNKTTYGWSSSEVDTYMAKNTDWGAIVYLINSTYGKNSEVWINSNNTFKIGCASDSVNASASATCNAYNSTIGQNASTTGNIYGVYDINGGAWEMTAAVYNNLVSGSEFTSTQLSGIASKYLNRYTTVTSDVLNSYGMNYDTSIYGDAIYETSLSPYRYDGTAWTGTYLSAWYDDAAYLPYTTNPWFLRGGYFSRTNTSGSFAFHTTTGAGGNPNYSFRPIISIIK